MPYETSLQQQAERIEAQISLLEEKVSAGEQNLGQAIEYKKRQLRTFRQQSASGFARLKAALDDSSNTCPFCFAFDNVRHDLTKYRDMYRCYTFNETIHLES